MVRFGVENAKFDKRKWKSIMGKKCQLLSPHVEESTYNQHGSSSRSKRTGRIQTVSTCSSAPSVSCNSSIGVSRSFRCYSYDCASQKQPDFGKMTFKDSYSKFADINSNSNNTSGDKDQYLSQYFQRNKPVSKKNDNLTAESSDSDISTMTSVRSSSSQVQYGDVNQTRQFYKSEFGMSQNLLKLYPDYAMQMNSSNENSSRNEPKIVLSSRKKKQLSDRHNSGSNSPTYRRQIARMPKYNHALMSMMGAAEMGPKYRTINRHHKSSPIRKTTKHSHTQTPRKKLKEQRQKSRDRETIKRSIKRIEHHSKQNKKDSASHRSNRSRHSRRETYSKADVIHRTVDKLTGNSTCKDAGTFRTETTSPNTLISRKYVYNCPTNDKPVSNSANDEAGIEKLRLQFEIGTLNKLKQEEMFVKKRLERYKEILSEFDNLNGSEYEKLLLPQMDEFSVLQQSVQQAQTEGAGARIIREDKIVEQADALFTSNAFTPTISGSSVNKKTRQQRSNSVTMCRNVGAIEVPTATEVLDDVKDLSVQNYYTINHDMLYSPSKSALTATSNNLQGIKKEFGNVYLPDALIEKWNLGKCSTQTKEASSSNGATKYNCVKTMETQTDISVPMKSRSGTTQSCAESKNFVSNKSQDKIITVANHKNSSFVPKSPRVRDNVGLLIPNKPLPEPTELANLDKHLLRDAVNNTIKEIQRSVDHTGDISKLKESFTQCSQEDVAANINTGMSKTPNKVTPVITAGVDTVINSSSSRKIEKDYEKFFDSIDTSVPKSFKEKARRLITNKKANVDVATARNTDEATSSNLNKKTSMSKTIQDFKENPGKVTTTTTSTYAISEDTKDTVGTAILPDNDKQKDSTTEKNSPSQLMIEGSDSDVLRPLTSSNFRHNKMEALKFQKKDGNVSFSTETDFVPLSASYVSSNFFNRNQNGSGGLKSNICGFQRWRLLKDCSEAPEQLSTSKNSLISSLLRLIQDSRSSVSTSLSTNEEQQSKPTVNTVNSSPKTCKTSTESDTTSTDVLSLNTVLKMSALLTKLKDILAEQQKIYTEHNMTSSSTNKISEIPCSRRVVDINQLHHFISIILRAQQERGRCPSSCNNHHIYQQNLDSSGTQLAKETNANNDFIGSNLARTTTNYSSEDQQLSPAAAEYSNSTGITQVIIPGLDKLLYMLEQSKEELDNL